jgi:putative FmdB family regulatory protein
MPFYEYQCRHCSAQHEALQKISDPPLRRCPECGKNGLVKLVSAPIFRLKGGGWYETDFKGDQDAKRNLAKGDDEKPAEKASEKASEKPAEKALEKPAEKTADKPADSGTKAPTQSASKSASKSVAKTVAKPAVKKAKAKAAPRRGK